MRTSSMEVRIMIWRGGRALSARQTRSSTYPRYSTIGVEPTGRPHSRKPASMNALLPPASPLPTTCNPSISMPRSFLHRPPRFGAAYGAASLPSSRR